MNKLFKKIKHGFTLVELVVVIAIIGILGAVSVVGYFGFVNNANESTVFQEGTQIKTVLLAGAADKASGFSYDPDTGLVLDKAAAGIGEIATYYKTVTETKTVLAEATSDSDATPSATNDTVVRYVTFTASNSRTGIIDFVSDAVKVLPVAK